MKEIPLRNRKGEVVAYAKVDDEDFDRLINHKWSLHNDRNNQYARASCVNSSKVKTTIIMHRYILGVSDYSIKVDHIDHCGLNNQKQNLRKATSSQNSKNRKKSLNVRNNTSKYKGVHSVLSKNGNKKYRASIRVENRKLIHLGYFSQEIDAAKAYNSAAIKHFGEFCFLNDV